MAKSRKGISNSKNRIRPILNNLIGTEEAYEIMDKLIVALSDSQVQMPQPGGIYVFQYFAKTEELLYDRYPVVGVEGVFDWGFTGVNFHIKDPRRYNFSQIASPIFQVRKEELNSLLVLPLEKLYQN